MRSYGTDHTAPLGALGASASNEYLPCAIGGITCAIPFQALREVIGGIPATVTLPSCPPAFIGVFAYRLRMYGLVDPLPHLLGTPDVPARLLPQRPVGAYRPIWFEGAVVAAHERERGLGQDGAVVLVGEGDRCLGLALDSIGASVVLNGTEIVPRARLRALPGLPVQSRYIAGLASLPGNTSGTVVLDVDPLLDDLLSALARSRPEGRVEEGSTR